MMDAGVLCSCAIQAMEAGLREVCRSVRIGKILIQRVRLFDFVIAFHTSRCSRDRSRTRRRLRRSCSTQRCEPRSGRCVERAANIEIGIAAARH